MSTKNTRERLLDAAEELVAMQGVARTSLRDITGQAEANLASVNYHFGSKEGIVKAMLERHLVPLNEKRLALLEKERAAARDGKRPLDAGAVMRALIEPVLHYIQAGEHGWRFMRIFSRLHTDPDPVLRRLFLKNVKALLDQFYQALLEALPHLSKETVFARMVFSFGAMGHAANVIADEQLKDEAASLGLPPLPNLDLLMEETIAYILRGMEAS